MAISKSKREAVYRKYNGHCAGGFLLRRWRNKEGERKMSVEIGQNGRPRLDRAERSGRHGQKRARRGAARPRV